jgi:transcriptional regulator with XRE-family HTH domain
VELIKATSSKEFAEVIRQRRQELNISKYQAATMVGVAYNVYDRAEEEGPRNLSNLFKFLEAFDIDLAIIKK